MHNDISSERLNELIEKAKIGDTRAFEIIVRAFYRYGLAVSFKILCDENDAKDVVQEGFIRIWKHLKNYDSKVKFSTWMYKIIMNLCYDKLKLYKRNKQMFEKLTDVDFKMISVSLTDTEKEFSNKETANLIKYFSNELSMKQRIIFILRDIEGLTINEVVEITGMSEASIKTNLFFARQNIRKKLISYEK